MDIVFHLGGMENQLPSLLVSVDGQAPSSEQVDALLQSLNYDARVKDLIAKQTLARLGQGGER